METPEALNLLTLLTFADSQGTSDKLWNGFKDALLWQLHARAMALLTGGTEFVRAGEAQRESLLRGSPGTGCRGDQRRRNCRRISPRCRRAISRSTRRRRSSTTSSSRIASCSRQVLEEGNALVAADGVAGRTRPRLQPRQSLHLGPRRACSAKSPARFSAVGLNILGAQIFTRTDGIVLDTFFVNDAATGNLATREQHDKFDSLLDRVLTGGGG